MSVFTRVTIGQYIPGESVIHNLDPRTKLVVVFGFMLIVFAANNSWTYGGLLLFTLMTIATARISWRILWTGLKPVWIILLFTFLFHIWFTREGELLWTWGFFNLYEQGLVQGTTLTLRIVLLVLMASLLTFTTKPLLLTDGLEKLLQPLKKFRFPVHEFALMMAIALRFIPTLMQEIDKLIKAQAARGASFTSGSFVKRVLNFIPILVPLFISAFQRADDLAIAMEARGYKGGEGRTQLRTLALQRRDWIVMIVAILFFCSILVGRNW